MHDDEDRVSRGQREFFRYMASNLVTGVLAGWAFLGALIWLDVGSLGTLLAGSPDAFWAVALAGMGFGVTFGSVALGTGVFLLPKDEPPKGGRLVPAENPRSLAEEAVAALRRALLLPEPAKVRPIKPRGRRDR